MVQEYITYNKRIEDDALTRASHARRYASSEMGEP